MIEKLHIFLLILFAILVVLILILSRMRRFFIKFMRVIFRFLCGARCVSHDFILQMDDYLSSKNGRITYTKALKRGLIKGVIYIYTKYL